MYDLVVRSGRIVTPDGVVMGDLGVEDERIAAIGQGLGPGSKEVEATGKIVFPGVLDAHVHLGVSVQGTRSVDDFVTGTRGALYGGCTTVIDFTAQEPNEGLVASFERRQADIAGQSYIDVGLHANFTSFSEENLHQVPELMGRGITSFKVFTAAGDNGRQMSDPDILRIAEVVGKAGGLLMLHAENGDAVEYLTRYLKAAGLTSAVDYETSRPDLVEAEAIFRVATYARLAGCPLYIAHLSSARGLEVIRRVREEGWEIHAETCPQYLILDNSYYRKEDGHRFITSPPLRETKDRQALLEALVAGEIGVISSDHLPFSMAQKDAAAVSFPEVPSGLPGLETRFSLMFGHLVSMGDGGLTPRSNASLLLLARVLAENPAKIFGLAPRKGALREGADADFILFDPNPSRRIRAGELHGGCDWTPYEGFNIRGQILSVYLRGRCLIEAGMLLGEPGWGRFVPGSR